MFKHRFRFIILTNIIANNRIVARTQARGELKMHSSVVDLVNFYRLYFLQLPKTLLHLYSLCSLITEPIHKSLDISYLFLLILISAKLLLTALFPKLKIFIILHLIVFNMTTSNLKRSVCYIINERAIVTNQHNCAATGLYKLL